MVKWQGRKKGPNVKENDVSVVILIKSSKLPVKEIEKITSLILETLSTTYDGKTIEIESKDFRVSSSISEGNLNSLSIHFSF